MKTINPGQFVYWKSEPAIVLELRGFSEACIRVIANKKTYVVRASELTERLESQSNSHGHLFATDREWDIAVERYELLKPLLGNRQRTLADVEELARKVGKSFATIYRWLQKVENTGLVSSLLRVPREDRGKSRLDEEVEQLIEAKIQSKYLVEERPSVVSLYNSIKHECQSCGLPIPHINTIYARVKSLDDEEKIRKRMGRKKAKEKFDPVLGKFPGGKHPNAVIQIDHTPMDVIVVDSAHRLPIGKPYLTIAIDVATKMLSGFVITLDPPSASTVGICVANSILTKDKWLAELNIDAEWPFYGKMEMIHVDNAKEFRGNMLKRACELYGIILENRPKGQPNFGPHVERAFRTFMSECQDLPGTTFSNVKDKLDYDSEGKACFTLAELELWFTNFIVYYYHHKPHRGNDNIAPIRLYDQLIHGNSEQPGVGLPFPVEDEETLRLNFTPFVERNIQRDGVVIDNIQYYSSILKQWVGRKDPESNKPKKFIFARDPRDISTVYFLDPLTSTYSPIPYLDNTRPKISLWELKAVRKSYKNQEIFSVNEEMIFEGIRRMREVESKAIEETRLAKQQRANEKRKRRMAERRENWNKASTNKPILPDRIKPSNDIDDEEELLPFDEIDF